MRFLKRGLAVAGLTVGAVALSVGVASATIAPIGAGDTGYASGTLTTSSPLGPSSCNIGLILDNVVSRAAGLGGTAEVDTPPNAATVSSGCSGVLTSVVLQSGYAWAIDASGSGPVSVTIPRVRANTVVGTCYYSVTLSGSYDNGTSTLSASGTATKLSGSGILCSSAPTLSTALVVRDAPGGSLVTIN